MHTRRRFLATFAAAGMTASIPLVSVSTASATTGSPQRNVAFSSANGSSYYHYYPSDTSGTATVVVLDGDGQYGVRNPDSTYLLAGPRGIVAEATRRGFNVLAVKTPAADNTWWRAGHRNAAYLADVIDKVRASKGLNASNTWFVGFSGGAQFITKYWLPRESGHFSGGALVMGGGGLPRNATFAPTAKASWKLAWISGAADTAANSDEGYDGVGEARRGAAYYRSAGFTNIYERYPAGVTHAMGGVFGTYLAQVLNHYKATGSGTPDVPTPAPTNPAPVPTNPAPASWSTKVSVGRDHADVTVTIPAGTFGRTRVTAYGPRGTYWYETVHGSGSKTVRMGDPGDMLKRGTAHTFKVTHGGATKASGSFTTKP